MRFVTSDSYQDKAVTKHLIFRNGDQHAALKYLIAYPVKKGEPFL
jgi:hypothetical protein